MKIPDTNLLRDLDALEASDPRFQRFSAWVRESLADYRASGDVLDGNDLYRNQGKCILLSDLLGYVDKSRDLLDRFA